MNKKLYFYRVLVWKLKWHKQKCGATWRHMKTLLGTYVCMCGRVCMCVCMHMCACVCD